MKKVTKLREEGKGIKDKGKKVKLHDVSHEMEDLKPLMKEYTFSEIYFQI
jgi:ssDNA-specific exonuclease RecJ